MKRSFVAVSLAAAAVAAMLLPAHADAQASSPLAGVWALNRSLSELPREIGFNVNWLPSPGSAGQSGGSSGGGGGRGRRGSGGGGGGSRGVPGSFPVSRESYDDARRVQFVTAEARNPAVRLMIVETPAAVTITNELGQSRSLHPTGVQESIELQGVPMLVTTKRDGDQLLVVYDVEKDRQVRYTYSHSASPPQLIVEVQFLEHGAGDKARRVYDAGVATETAAPPAAATPPASSKAPAETFDERPGAELKGLKSLGILVENLSTQAVACGLNHDALEAALAKRLTDGGFTVRRNSDEDTYLYVNVMTTNLPGGTCVSRYDAFLYTHATANLTYRDQPALVQVSLMHRGGIGSSAPTAHAAAVSRGLEGYVDLFITQIRDANK
jgi:hypothetical protein